MQLPGHWMIQRLKPRVKDDLCNSDLRGGLGQVIFNNQK